MGRLTDFPIGSLSKVSVGGQDILIANLNGSLFGIANTCTHRGGPLNEGELEGSTVTCPWHGGQFDVKTGKVVGPPPMRDEASFDVRVEGDEVLLKRR